MLTKAYARHRRRRRRRRLRSLTSHQNEQLLRPFKPERKRTRNERPKVTQPHSRRSALTLKRKVFTIPHLVPAWLRVECGELIKPLNSTEVIYHPKPTARAPFANPNQRCLIPGLFALYYNYTPH